MSKKYILHVFRMKSAVFAKKSSRSSKDHRRSFVVRRFLSRQMPMAPDGPIAESRRLSIVEYKRLRISANAW